MATSTINPPSVGTNPTLLGQYRRHWWRYLIGAGLLATQQGLMYGRDIFFQKGVDAARHSSSDAALAAAGWALTVIVVAAGVRILSRMVIFNAGRAVEYELRAALLAKLHTLGATFFRTIPTGDILSRSTNDLNQLRLLTGFGVLNVFNTIFALVSALSVMLRVSGTLTVAALAILPLLLLVMRWVGKQIYQRNRENQEAMGAMSAQVQASLAGVRVVRNLGLEAAEEAAFNATSRAYLEKSLALARLRGALAPVMGTVSAIGMLTVFWYGGHMVLTKAITEGEFVAFWAALGRLVWPMLAFGFILSIVQRGRASWLRLKEIFAAEPLISDGDEHLNSHGPGRVEIVGLQVEVDGNPLLSNVDFTIEPGRSVAIVGRTGSGKSVLAASLPRLMPVGPGMIFLDGKDVCQLALDDVRRTIVYAQQDAFLFSTTIATNVAFTAEGNGGPEQRQAMERAARQAQVLSEIEGLSHGWNTVVGERGVQLSGGQRQRVALARALMSRSPVLVLDDPLSAVDAKTEAAILDALDEQAKERSLVLVTHRVAAAARCDHVVVLDGGKMVQQGTHEQLMATPGLYQEFAEEQRVEGELAALAREGAQ